MTDIAAEVAFMRMLAKLESDVRLLEDAFGNLSFEQLSREANTAKALLSSLWDKLQTAQLDPSRVYGALSDIQYRLRSLELKAATRCSTPTGFKEFLIWAYNFVAKVVNLVTWGVGIGPVLPQLPDPKETNLLKITFIENIVNCEEA